MRILVLIQYLLTAYSVCQLNAQSKQEVPRAIQLNQVGYYPGAPKLAIVSEETDSAGNGPGTFYITNGLKVVKRGMLGPLVHSMNSSLITRVADFSTLREEGEYTFYLGSGKGGQLAASFRIAHNALHAAAVASLKAFYYQRASMSLDAKYAGIWLRAAGHPDTAVQIHPSAAGPRRRPGDKISSPGGWYDAGDYNKYIVNSGISTATLLSLYEDMPAFMGSVKVAIPESGNGVPDILNEALYNIKWMITMQDPADGGVYHKCTNASFDGMIMPADAKATRYVVAKSTTATLDFAAVMAQSARTFSKFGTALPGFADTCRHRAMQAWAWASHNPAVLYDQEQNNSLFKPPVKTGDYGDTDVKDEWFWAAAELYATTRDKKYLERMLATLEPANIPSWSKVNMLGYYTLLRIKPVELNSGSFSLPEISGRVISLADKLEARANANAFKCIIGGAVSDFVWGSNAVAANQGILFIEAYRLSGKQRYLNAALSNADYILGRNATGYCFLTGFGSKSTMHPHHRVSVADNIVLPVPGLLAGGPNPGRQDHTVYSFTEPETAYTDQSGAYASNEIAINWNAPLVYLLFAAERYQ